jgi:ribosomal protein S18 acetylase RimI-like enzyme
VTPETDSLAPRVATAASTDDLLELLQGVRKELLLRGEDFPGSWVEQAAADLRVGRQPGWVYPPAPGPGGIAFGNVRDRRAWGHVHALRGPDSLRLATALLDTLEPDVEAVSLGFSGLPIEIERGVLQNLATRPGGAIIERYAMVRTLRPGDISTPTAPPDGLSRVPIREVTVEALADLDWRSFRGSTDDRLVGGSIEEYTRVLEGLLGNGMGLFLDAASTALLQEEPPRLIAGILTSQVSAHEATFLDIMVDPEFRRHGYGRFLVRWAMRSLVGLGYERVRLWVTASNGTARTLYEAEGFLRVATTSIYRWDRPGEVPHPHASR